MNLFIFFFFFFSSRRRHTRSYGDWSSDVCSSDLADEALERLAIAVPLTVYQAQQATQLNAALFYIPGEAHVVIEGPMLTLLTPDEMRAVLGHELSHYRLWQEDDGEFLVMDRMVQAMANDRRTEPSH